MGAFAEGLKLYGERQYAQALQSVRAEARATKRHTRDPLYQRLVDEICMHSAATGQVIGFDGRLLQVFPCNPDSAWLGVNEPRRPSPTGPDASVLQFSSIHDALAEADDGDVVQLLPGTHTVSQAMLQVSRRVMITATPGSTPQQVVLDHRANHPAFHIDRSCILRGFSIDMVGFTECCVIAGASTTVKPILQDLLIQCSGDDGVSVRGKAQPLMRGCQIRARHCGLTQKDQASSTLWQCTISGGKHALIAAGSSQTFLEGCTLADCSQEGVMGLQSARVSMTDTKLSGCHGPAVDMSDESSLVLKQVDVAGCQGGIWLWHKSSCEAICSYISGGATYAVLLDAEAYARGSSCSIDGPCHVQGMPGEEEEGEEGGVDSAGARAGGTITVALGSQPLSREAFKAALAARAASMAAAAAGGGAPHHPHQVPAAAALNAFSPAHGRGGHGLNNGHNGHGGYSPGGVPQSPYGSSNGSSQACLTEMDLCGDELVHPAMLVPDAAAAAGFFPAEQGAFAPPQRTQYAHY